MRSEKPRHLNRVSQIKGFECVASLDHMFGAFIIPSFLCANQILCPLGKEKKKPIKCIYAKLWMAGETVILRRYTMEIRRILRPCSLLSSSHLFSLQPCGDLGTAAILPFVSRLDLNVWFLKIVLKILCGKKIKYVCGLLCNGRSNGCPEVLQV